jgi:hypothetical protein
MICWFENDSNDVSSIDTYVFLLSGVSSRKTGIYVHPFNFRKSLSLYIARNRDIISPTDFLIHNNVYLAPKVSK